MHVRTSGFVLLALAASSISAQDQKIADTVKAQVKKVVAATVAGNYDLVVDMTHPKALEGSGGKDKAKQQIKAAMETVKKLGFTFEVSEVGEPRVKKGDKDYFAVTPYTLVINGMGKKVTTKTAMVGVSADDSKTWKFINVDAGGEAKIRRLLPDLPRELTVPKQENKVEDAP